MKLPLCLIMPFVILGQPALRSPGITAATITHNTEKDAAFAVLSVPPGPLTLRAVTLEKLIMDAYDIPRFQLIVGPQWVRTERWDLQVGWDGKMRPQRDLMLEIVKGRFRLKTHRESRVTSIYELKEATKGSRLRPDPDLDARGPFITNRAGSIHLRNSSLKAFARLLSLHLGKPIIDRVGTAGLFRFSLDWVPGPSEDTEREVVGFPIGTPRIPNTSGPIIFKAIQEQLGLRLVPTRGLVEVIVVDEVEWPRTH